MTFQRTPLVEQDRSVLGVGLLAQVVGETGEALIPGGLLQPGVPLLAMLTGVRVVGQAVFHVGLQSGHALVGGFEVETVAQHIEHVLMAGDDLANAFVGDQHHVTVVDHGVGRTVGDVGKGQVSAAALEWVSGLVALVGKAQGRTVEDIFGKKAANQASHRVLAGVGDQCLEVIHISGLLVEKLNEWIRRRRLPGVANGWGSSRVPSRAGPACSQRSTARLLRCKAP